MLWEELRAGDFAAAVERSRGVCVLPVGSTEKHGPHLPLGTDSMIGRHVARDAAERADVVVFETFNYGQLLGFQHHPGSICLSTTLIEDYLTALCAEIARNGFKKIILLSCHGGNEDIVRVIAQRTQESKKDYVIVTGNGYPRHPDLLLKHLREEGRDAFPELTDEDVATLESFCAERRLTGHACFEETLALLGVRPDLADLSIMDTESGANTHRFDHLKAHGLYSPYIWAGSYPNHYQSDYHPGANDRIGRALHELNVRRVAALFRAVKEDEELLRINAEWNAKW